MAPPSSTSPPVETDQRPPLGQRFFDSVEAGDAAGVQLVDLGCDQGDGKASLRLEGRERCRQGA